MNTVSLLRSDLMSRNLALTSSAAKRTWSIAEKRRVVELTMREGVSVGTIAKQYNIHPPMLSTWRTLYRDGKLVDNPTAIESTGETFLPIKIADSHPALFASTNPMRVQMNLPCGASLCLEADTLDLQAIATLFTLVRK